VTLLTPREAANRLGIHVRSLQRIIASGDLPVVRVLSSTPRIRLEDLTDFIENRTVYRAKVNENAC
jgi:excisionase family DNA binding protein